MEATPADRAARIAQVRGYRPLAALIPAHWSRGYVSANGIRHHYYRTGGAKPPALLLHGIFDGALTWLRTARALEPDYDVIMVDARGHGHSDRAGGTYSPETLVEDAAGVIRGLGLGAVRLLGHSQGASTGLLLAARSPELVRALIMEGMGESDAPATDVASSPGYQAWFRGYLAWLEALPAQTEPERLVASLAQLPPGAPVPPEEQYVPWVDASAHLDLELVRGSMALWGMLGEVAREMEAALERVACPVLIMKSEFFPQPGGTPAVREEPSVQPNVRVVRFEHTGHLIHHEQFDLFIGLARDFFRGA